MKLLRRSRYYRVHRRRRARWLLLILLVVGAWFVFAKPRVSSAQFAPPVPVAIQPPNMQGETYWSGDVTVEEGQVIEGDLVVYSGDVTIQDGGKVNGSVIDYSGDVTVEEGGTVTGDLTAWSGTVEVDGAVNGSIAAWSGDITLGENAAVRGDVSAMSGTVERSEEATIQGSVVRGPGFKWPGVVNPFSEIGAAPPATPAAPLAPQPVPNQVRNDYGGPVRGFAGFVLRIFGAVFFSALAALLAALVFNVRPELVSRIRTNLQEQPVYAAVAGAVINLPMSLVAGLLFVTFCLAPLALPPMLLLLVLNVIGVSGIAQIVGERLTKALNLKLEPLFVIGLGAFAVVGVLSILWAFGGCFRGIAWLIGFVVGSMGVGAFVMPWVKNFGSGSSTYAGPPSGNLPSTSLAKVDVQIGGSSAPATPAPEAPSSEPVAELQAPEAPIVAETVTETPTVATDTIVEPEVAQTTASVTPDDFTIIKGIGSVLDRRLKEAGILTFEQLAELSPERMAEIFDRPLDWIVEDDIPGQARYFASKK